MASFIKSFLSRSPAAPGTSSPTPKEGQIVSTSYTSKPVNIPADFLRTPGPEPVYRVIDWSETDLQENEGKYAAVLDGVMSAEECATLIRLCEESTGAPAGQAWRPAMVNAGVGREVLMTDYRNSDRIIWDSPEVLGRIWDRMARVPGLKERLAVVSAATARTGDWDFDRLNERGRFLKYSPGGFFKPHTDGAYYYESGGRNYCTHYTIQLYLNDSVGALMEDGLTEEEAAAKTTLVGGSTAFLSQRTSAKSGKRIGSAARLDVHPKMGRVLLFQHSGLYHSGEPVEQGEKVTMRSDVVYVQRKKKL